MSLLFYPEKETKRILKKYGIDYDNLYSSDLSSITKADKAALRRLSPELYRNIMRTVKKLNKSAEKKEKLKQPNHLKYDTNIERTAINTIQFQMMNEIESKEKERIKNGESETMVKVLPSRAKEQDVYHARFYGRKMTLTRALEIGITVRYGCKCGLEIINNTETVKEVVRNV